MGKRDRDVRDVQASLACELANAALELTKEPALDHAATLRRIKVLVEGLEVTATALLTHNGISWEQVGLELDGVRRQTIHRRLNGRVVALMNSEPGVVPLSSRQIPLSSLQIDADGARIVIGHRKWVKQLEQMEATLREVGSHPAIVRHRRRASSGLKT